MNNAIMETYYTPDALNCGDLACEVLSIASMVSILKLCVKPDDKAFAGHSYPTELTIENAFYVVERSLERIADALEELEKIQLNA